MGLEIVRKESLKYPGRRSRLRDSEDVYNVLRNNLGTDKVEAMQIDVTSQFVDVLHLNVDTFKKMTCLRFLKINFPLHAELCMPPSRVKELLQDVVDSKGRDLDKYIKFVIHGHNFLRTLRIQKEGTLIDPSCQRYSHNSEVGTVHTILRDADEPMLSLEKQVASLLSGCEDLKNIASEIHIKCLHYFAIDGWSGPEEFSVTSKETKQFSITHPQPGMEILNSSIGFFSNVDDSDVVHVDDEPFKNLPKDIFCLRCTDYLKLSKSTEQDTQKPKLHILFDGLKVYKGIISFHHGYHVFEDPACIPVRLFSWIDKIVGVPLKISVLSWCREFVVEEHHAKMLREVLPPGPKVRITTFWR